MLYIGGVRLGLKKNPQLVMLAKGFLSVHASSSPSERLFSSGRGSVTYKRGKLSPRIISVLMTLKSWVKKDEIDNDDEEFDEDGSNFYEVMLSPTFFQINKFHR